MSASAPAIKEALQELEQLRDSFEQARAAILHRLASGTDVGSGEEFIRSIAKQLKGTNEVLVLKALWSLLRDGLVQLTDQHVLELGPELSSTNGNA